MCFLAGAAGRSGFFRDWNILFDHLHHQCMFRTSVTQTRFRTCRAPVRFRPASIYCVFLHEFISSAASSIKFVLQVPVRLDARHCSTSTMTRQRRQHRVLVPVPPKATPWERQTCLKHPVPVLRYAQGIIITTFFWSHSSSFVYVIDCVRMRLPFMPIGVCHNR